MAILSKPPHLSAWRRLYAAVVTEYIPPGFRTHVFVARVTGVWPTATDSHWYKWLTVSYFLFVGFVLQFTIFINLVFVHTIEQSANPIFLSVEAWCIAFQVGVIYSRHNSIREIFRIHANLSSDVECNVGPNERVAHQNYLVHVGLAVLYFFWWLLTVAQVILAKRDTRLFTSTTHWPYDFAQNNVVYMVVLVYQVAITACAVIWAGMEDAITIALLNVNCGHFAELKQRLQQLGDGGGGGGGGGGSGEDRNRWFYRDLMECCQRYENCLKFGGIINDVVSMSFLVQFAVSAMIFCTTLYFLSVINPMDDIFIFVNVIIYFCCASSQTWLNCHFGSCLSHETEGITHAIYSSPWMDRNEQCKRGVRILVERSRRPMTIYAGGLFELSLPTFVSICRSAYSYFNILRSLD